MVRSLFSKHVLERRTLNILFIITNNILLIFFFKISAQEQAYLIIVTLTNKMQCGIGFLLLIRNYGTVSCGSCSLWWHIKCASTSQNTSSERRTLDLLTLNFISFLLQSIFWDVCHNQSSGVLKTRLTVTQQYTSKKVIFAHLNIHNLRYKFSWYFKW